MRQMYSVQFGNQEGWNREMMPIYQSTTLSMTTEEMGSCSILKGQWIFLYKMSKSYQ